MDEQIDNTIPYFRNLWQTNMIDLQSQCDTWEKICRSDSIPDEVNGDIRTNIGLAKLLMNQKLKQFKGLIDDSEFNTGEKEITCLDLQGFWDMVYNEVLKIKQCFIRLEKCKNNEWKLDDLNSDNRPKKKVPVKREITVSKEKVDGSLKSHSLAAKQRLAEAKKKMIALRELEKKQNFVEIAEFNSNGFNHTEILNSDDKGKLSDTTNMTVMNEAVEILKQDLLVNEEQISSTKTSDKVETVGLNKETKYKANLQKDPTPFIQNKENFIPDNSSKMYNSKVHIKSSEKLEETSTKKRSKQKDYGKLQCVTRSAKKALYQQNMPQNA